MPCRSTVPSPGPLRGIEGATTKVQKSQIGFATGHPFAAVWLPERYLGRPAAPLVLSLYLKHRLDSSRFKEITEPKPGRFTHHLELRRAADVDASAREWLERAAEEGRD